MDWREIEFVLKSVVEKSRGGPVVILDLDDVVFDTMPSIVRYINARFGTDYKVADVRSWHIPSEPWVRDGYVTPHDAVWIFRRVAMEGIPPKPWAVHGVRRLAEFATVLFLTKRTHYIEEAARKNLEEIGLGGYPFVNAPFVRGGKLMVIRRLLELGGNVALVADDGPYNLEELFGVVPTVGFRMPYNRVAPADWWVSGWLEFVPLAIHKLLA